MLWKGASHRFHSSEKGRRSPSRPPRGRGPFSSLLLFRMESTTGRKKERLIALAVLFTVLVVFLCLLYRKDDSVTLLGPFKGPLPIGLHEKTMPRSKWDQMLQDLMEDPPAVSNPVQRQVPDPAGGPSPRWLTAPLHLPRTVPAPVEQDALLSAIVKTLVLREDDPTVTGALIGTLKVLYATLLQEQSTYIQSYRSEADRHAAAGAEGSTRSGVAPLTLVEYASPGFFLGPALQRLLAHAASAKTAAGEENEDNDKRREAEAQQLSESSLWQLFLVDTAAVSPGEWRYEKLLDPSPLLETVWKLCRPTRPLHMPTLRVLHRGNGSDAAAGSAYKGDTPRRKAPRFARSSPSDGVSSQAFSFSAAASDYQLLLFPSTFFSPSFWADHHFGARAEERATIGAAGGPEGGRDGFEDALVDVIIGARRATFLELPNPFIDALEQPATPAAVADAAQAGPLTPRGEFGLGRALLFWYGEGFLTDTRGHPSLFLLHLIERAAAVRGVRARVMLMHRIRPTTKGHVRDVYRVSVEGTLGGATAALPSTPQRLGSLFEVPRRFDCDQRSRLLGCEDTSTTFEGSVCSAFVN